MIKESDLMEAIAECQGERNPNANTCIKLAAYYTILNNLRKGEEKEIEETRHISYSYDDKPSVYTSESEFGKILPKLDLMDAMRVIDELMETLRIIHPALYEASMRQLAALE